MVASLTSLRSLMASKPETPKTAEPDPYVYQVEIVWRNVIVFAYLHLVCLYTIFNVVTFNVNPYTWAFNMVFGYTCAFGITAGVHRLWSHRAYKAKWPLRLLLAYFQTVGWQNHIFEWARDHRVHHKYTDTDADPHNSLRGFFFCHVGWLLCRKHRDVIEKGKTIDVSDLEQDPIVMFQKRYFMILMPLCTFITPTLLPMFLWGDTFWSAWHLCVYRYIVSANITWCVNSFAHMYGMKPYDKAITPVENVAVAHLTCGEGWHNFHHTFPWDWKGSELGDYNKNLTNAFLDAFAWLGLAYDFRTVNNEIIRNKILTSGDGSHPISQERNIWGWGDKDIDEKHMEIMEIMHPQKEK